MGFVVPAGHFINLVGGVFAGVRIENRTDRAIEVELAHVGAAGLPADSVHREARLPPPPPDPRDEPEDWWMRK